MNLTDRQQAILDFLLAHQASHGRPPTRAEIAQAFGFSQARSAEDHLRALAAKGAIALEPGRSRGIRVLHPGAGAWAQSGTAGARGAAHPGTAPGGGELGFGSRPGFAAYGFGVDVDPAYGDEDTDFEPASGAEPHDGSGAETGTRAGARNFPAASLLSLPLVGRVAAGAPILSDAHIAGRYGIDRALFRPRPHFLLRVEGDSMRDAGILDGDLIAVHRTPVAESGQIVVARLDDEITVKRLKRQRDGGLSLLPENPDYAPIPVDPSRQAFAIEGIHVGSIRRG